MRTLLLLVLVAALSFILLPARADSMSGSWTTEISDGEIHLVLHRDDRQGNIMGRSHPVDRFEGLPDREFEGPSTFTLTSEAGTISFEGSFRNGRGVGWYELAPDAAFNRELRVLGFSEPDADASLLFTLEGLLLDQIRGLQSLGYELDDDDLLQATVFRIDAAFVREMEAIGWKDLPFGTLVELRVGHVDAGFVRDMEAFGVRELDASEVAHLAIVGVTPDYVRGMSELGYGGLTAGEYLQMKALSIDPEYIRGLDSQGLKRLPPGELVRIRALGVDEILLERD